MIQPYRLTQPDHITQPDHLTQPTQMTELNPLTQPAQVTQLDQTSLNVQTGHLNVKTGLSACPAYSGLADFGLEKTLPLYFVDEKYLVGI